jgi:hypothetical protein
VCEEDKVQANDGGETGEHMQGGRLKVVVQVQVKWSELLFCIRHHSSTDLSG